MTTPFWKTKPLEDMNRHEWESLCDGCAQCCLHKLEDDETGEVYVTQIVCHLLDLETCQCGDYGNRSERVPTCVTMTAADARTIRWMPKSCAYRLLSENKPLAPWHPLISGQQRSVIDADVSVQGKAISDKDVPEKNWPDYIVEQLF